MAGLQSQTSKGAVLFALSKMAALGVEAANSFNCRFLFSTTQNDAIYAKDL